MSPFNPSDFFAYRQLDLENKLVLPTVRLYKQVSFQLNALYQDIRNALIDAHSVVASAAKQVYDQPMPTLTAWYEQGVQTGSLYYAQAQAVLMPVYQEWQGKFTLGKEQISRQLQAFWNNPEQTTLDALAPVSQYVTNAAEQSGLYWQQFSDNPEQFLAAATAPIGNYLSSFSDAAEAALISGYYTLAELFGLLLEQPSATLQALYRNTLSSLLDIYFDLVSSLLVIA